MIISSYMLKKRNTGQPYLFKSADYVCEDTRIRSPEDIYGFLDQTIHISDNAEEYVYMLCLSTAMRIIGIFELSHGTVKCAPITMRELMIRALLCGAVTIVIAHNHPSGDPSPSSQDLDVCKQIADACKFMGLNFADFIICGDGAYCSLKEIGMIKQHST